MKKTDNAEVVAICDKLPETLEAHRQKAEGREIALYDNFDDFIHHEGKMGTNESRMKSLFCC